MVVCWGNDCSSLCAEEEEEEEREEGGGGIFVPSALTEDNKCMFSQQPQKLKIKHV